MKEIKIEHGIPRRQNPFAFVKRALLKMDVGDSFLYPVRSSAYNAARRVGMKIETHKINGSGFRIWLVSKKAK